MSEPIEIVEDYLQSQTFVGANNVNLRTFMGGNYFSTPVAPPGFQNTHKAIIFHSETGSSHITGSTREAFLVFKCYGGTASFANARAVREALWQYLHNARGKATAAGILARAEETNRIQDLSEPVTGWPVAIARYRVTTSNNV